MPDVVYESFYTSVNNLYPLYWFLSAREALYVKRIMQSYWAWESRDHVPVCAKREVLLVALCSLE